MELLFELVGDNYIPKIILGLGDGVLEKSGKAEIYKPDTGFELNYYANNTGVLRQIKFADNGIYINGLKYELTALNIASNSFQASYGDVIHDVQIQKDGSGRIISLAEGGVSVPITYNEV